MPNRGKSGASAKRGAESVELERRAEPTQKRAKELVDKILDITGDLLDEVGVDALTTNLIAERADIRVASIYRYFPNKFAIIVALWERLFDRELTKIDAFMREAAEAMPLAEVVDTLVDTVVEIEQTEPGFIPLRRAMRATPELQEVEARTNLLIARSIEEWIGRLGGRVPADRTSLVSRMMTEMTLVVLDLALPLEEDEAGSVIDEYKLMMKSYLANYFDLEPA